MPLFEVFGERRSAAATGTVPPAPDRVGTMLAPDLDMAFLLARETFFRRGEGQRFGVRRLGSTDDIRWSADDEVVGGATDRSYRRPDGYVGVGAKFTRVRDELRRRGLAPAKGSGGA